jgi:hypothetical protein
MIKNPWAKESFNLTEQGRLIKTRPDIANIYRLSASLDEYISQQIQAEVFTKPMKTEFHSMETELDTAQWPLDPAVIPNHMGINLCSVEGMSWTRQGDQLVSLTIHFLPA